MQTRYLSTLSLALGGLSAFAQITLNDQQNVPVIGDVYAIHKAAYAAPPPAGAGVLFDYSTLSETGTGTWNCIDPSVYSNPAAFPTATRALTNGQDTMFLKVSNLGLERVGERQQILIYSVEVPFSDPSVDMGLPLQYQDVWNDNIAATSFDVGGTNSSRIGTIHGEADAWGTLQLPGGGAPVPVLRVTTYKQEVNTVGIITVTHHRHQTDYYGQFLHLPLVRVYSDSLTSSLGINSFNSGIEWLDASATAVGTVSAPNDVFLSPNPASQQVTVRAAGAVRLEVADAAGRIVASRSMMNGAAELDVEHLHAGIYVVSAFDRQGRASRNRLVVR